MIQPLNTDDFPHRDRDDLLNVIEKAAIALADQAVGAAAAPTAEEPLASYPYDITTLNLKERLSDGKPRFVGLKAAKAILGFSVDTVIRRIKDRGVGFKLSGRWYLDRTLLHRIVM